MSFEGSLLVVGLREVLQHLSGERGTGILTLQNEREILAVTFQRGEIVGADSLAEGEEILGALLAQEHLVSPQEFAAVVAAQRTGGGRIADLLLERGSIGRDALLGALRRHTLRLVFDVLSWSDGSYKFYAGEEVSFEEGFDPIAVEEVLASAPAGVGGRSRGAGATGTGGARATASPIAPADRSAESFEAHSKGALHGLESLSEITSSADAPPLRPGSVRSAPRPAAPRQRRGVLVPPDPSGSSRPGSPAAAVGLAPTERAALGRGAAARSRLWQWETLRPVLPTLAAFLAFTVWFAMRPLDLVLSLPWSAGVRDEFHASRRIAAFEQIDAAARAFFLVAGRYPDDLAALIERGLLGPRADRDPSGRALRFSSNGLIYALETVTEGSGPGSIGAVESVAGDLFLDATLFEAEAGREGAPLVLLD